MKGEAKSETAVDSNGGSERKASNARSAAAPVAVLAVIMLLLAPLFYALSIGPLVWLDSRSIIHVDDNSLVVTFYMPLVYVAERCQPLEDSMTWYISLWETPTPSIPGPVMPSPVPASPPAAPATVVPGPVGLEKPPISTSL